MKNHIFFLEKIFSLWKFVRKAFFFRKLLFFIFRKPQRGKNTFSKDIFLFFLMEGRKHFFGKIILWKHFVLKSMYLFEEIIFENTLLYVEKHFWKHFLLKDFGKQLYIYFFLVSDFPLFFKKKKQTFFILQTFFENRF